MALMDGGFDVNLPKMVKVKQFFNGKKIENIEETVYSELEQEAIRKRFKPGQRIAVTVGSRGVASIAKVTKAIIDKLKEFGTEPFIIPAMGSHGGVLHKGKLMS